MNFFAGKNVTYYVNGSCTEEVANFDEKSNMGIPGFSSFKYSLRNTNHRIIHSNTRINSYLKQVIINLKQLQLLLSS
jgi:hypothetical protein